MNSSSLHLLYGTSSEGKNGDSNQTTIDVTSGRLREKGTLSVFLKPPSGLN